MLDASRLFKKLKCYMSKKLNFAGTSGSKLKVWWWAMEEKTTRGVKG
jgi:hypothetical protein